MNDELKDSRFITKKLAAQEVLSELKTRQFLIMFLTTIYCLNLVFRQKFTTYSLIVDALFLGAAGVLYYWAQKKTKNLTNKYLNPVVPKIEDDNSQN